jgi:hypothetical protein
MCCEAGWSYIKIHGLDEYGRNFTAGVGEFTQVARYSVALAD